MGCKGGWSCKHDGDKNYDKNYEKTVLRLRGHYNHSTAKEAIETAMKPQLNRLEPYCISCMIMLIQAYWKYP